jgi:hypothetical protein
MKEVILQNMQEQYLFYAKIFMIFIFQVCILFGTMQYGIQYRFSKSFWYHILFLVLSILVIESIPRVADKFLKFLLFSLSSFLLGLLMTYYITLSVPNSITQQGKAIQVIFSMTILLYIYIYIYECSVASLNPVLKLSDSVIFTLFFFFLFLILFCMIYLLTPYFHSPITLLFLGIIYFIVSTFIAYYTTKRLEHKQENPIYTSTDYIIYFTRQLNQIVYSFFHGIYTLFFR